MPAVFAVFIICRTLRLIFIRERIVIFYPIADVYLAVLVARVANYDPLDARIDNDASAHHAVARSGNDSPALGIGADHIHRRAVHLLAGGGDDRVLLCVNAATELISLTMRNVHPLAQAEAHIRAIFASARSAVLLVNVP